MKLKLLAAAASIAFIAPGVAAQAQQGQRRSQRLKRKAAATPSRRLSRGRY